jgi:hypothetical protein
MYVQKPFLSRTVTRDTYGEGEKVILGKKSSENILSPRD